MSVRLTDMSSQQMLALLDDWQARGWLRALDVALVRFLAAEVPAMPPALMLATALVSHQLGRGHACLDLGNVLADPYMSLSLPPEQDGYAFLSAAEQIHTPQPGDLLAGLSLDDWRARLRQTDLVETLGEADEDNAAAENGTPLVLVGERLYLRRYWRYERQVEAAITQRISGGMQTEIAGALPEVELRASLAALFPPTQTQAPAADGSETRTDWQKIACAVAARSAFSIITGGPGTGKTTTVVRLLALLQSLALNGTQRPLRIALAAPTGKAAARLKASIAGAIDQLPGFVQDTPALRASIPDEVTTLHRLLGTRPGPGAGSRGFRHDARNPLALDLLVVDEASMVDLEMMAALLLALPPQARLIILGDKDQLASVEAGSVLGELCRRARQGHFRPATADWIAALTGEKIESSLLDENGTALDQHIVMLRDSRRFAAGSGIGRLAAAVNAGQPEKIRAVWTQACADIQRLDLGSLEDERLAALLLGDGGDDGGIAGYLRIVHDERPELTADQQAFDDWARAALRAQGRFQLLCALRSGAYGVEGMNRRIETLLARRGLIEPFNAAASATPLDPWYPGRPVLVTRNDHRLGLMNGDIGITLACPVRDGRSGQLAWGRRVAFPRADGSGIQWVLPSRLQAAETVFALTVHKSQGSEFDHCALLLPPGRSPVLTRELLYTGITRGKRRFSLLCCGGQRSLDEAAMRTVQRSGGLFAGVADDADT
ncbi:exonuclease V (RecBCD complex), alpha chain [Sterolibacterium denitrificans]|uniref:RecBCD enzyme subunit RecD n=1 Tax=Sterolibacterium denitrificans TaxID=157592 RepID=A0A7Z7HQ74_9PROT|nr:exodeoxyribonuclease V subunit alpha [Sterolibacterium denitrificans]SMB24446.1 exonuclease V (RecBCD complex), alpha chain [Sterolibacterium denitrificans]